MTIRTRLIASAIAATALGLGLTACGSNQPAQPAAAAPTSAPSTAAAPTSDTATHSAPNPADTDPIVRGECLHAGIDYVPLRAALANPTLLRQLMRLGSPQPQTMSLAATTQAGKEAEVAMSQVAFQLSLEHVHALTGQPIDVTTLSTAISAVTSACAPLGVTV